MGHQYDDDITQMAQWRRLTEELLDSFSLISFLLRCV